MSSSKIVKAPFVAMSEIRREIQTIDPNNPKIIGSVNKMSDVKNKASETSDASKAIEETVENAAISETVIDGSNTFALEKAQEEIEHMLTEAKLEAESIKELARQEGYEAGYEAGTRNSDKVISEKIKALDEKSRLMADQLEEEKTAYRNEMAPRIAAVIKSLVETIVGSHEDDPQVIIYLIRLAFEEIHTYGSFLIKVAEEDFDYVMTHKEALVKGLSEKVDVEILMDTNMRKNQCYIETEMGNVDASLDLRLESLSRELKLIGDSLK